MSDVCPRLLVELLHACRPSMPAGLSSDAALDLLLRRFFHLWPQTPTDPCTNEFVNGFYQHQLSEDCSVPLVWSPTNGGEWKRTSECVLLNAQAQLPGSHFAVAIDVLGALGQPVAVVADSIKRKLMENGMSTMSFEEFSTVFFANLAWVHPDSRDCLVQHMLTLMSNG